jgi:transposase
MPLIYPDAAGIDVGAEEHWVCVPADRDAQPIQKFSAFTCDLHRLADWLTACQITSVVMESTGVYWIPLFQSLEAREFAVPWSMLATSKTCLATPTRIVSIVNGYNGCIVMAC